MGTANHTPGPWEFHEDEMDIVAANGVSICHVLNSDDFPCITDDEHGSEEENRAKADAECEANARLIKAAPDLLASLRDVALAYKALRRRAGYDEDDASDSLDSTDRAIAKAEG